MGGLRLAFLVFFAAAISGCGDTGTRAPSPVFHADDNPQRLSEWGQLSVDGNVMFLGENVTPYDLATPLFSDYASKLRTVWMEDGSPAQYDPKQTFDFPLGTVITKTFYFEQDGAEWSKAVKASPAPVVTNGELPLTRIRLMETRLLVKRAEGWIALPYVWNDEQTDAVLKRTGDIKPLTLVRADTREDFAYVVPNQNQCAGCHATNATTKAILPIGPKARHLNKPSTFVPGFNQLDHWIAAGLLDGDFANAGAPPMNAVWTDETASLDARARAYLDANCSHCHNPNGAADTSGLNLEPDADGPSLGLCKPPIAAGSGSGGRPYDIVPGAPHESITVYRMESEDPGAMMPELGRAVAHDEGVALIAQWIADMEGGCS